MRIWKSLSGIAHRKVRLVTFWIVFVHTGLITSVLISLSLVTYWKIVSRSFVRNWLFCHDHMKNIEHEWLCENCKWFARQLSSRLVVSLQCEVKLKKLDTLTPYATNVVLLPRAHCLLKTQLTLLNNNNSHLVKSLFFLLTRFWNVRNFEKR